jgi:hypothetical protein
MKNAWMSEIVWKSESEINFDAILNRIAKPAAPVNPAPVMDMKDEARQKARQKAADRQPGDDDDTKSRKPRVKSNAPEQPLAPGKHDKDSIKAMIESNPIAMVRGVLRLYEWQTADEKSSRDTKYANGAGFSACHVLTGTRLAEMFIKNDILARLTGGAKATDILTAKQIADGIRVASRHAGQLARYANAK